MSHCFSASLNMERIVFFHGIIEWCGRFRVASFMWPVVLNPVYKKWTYLPHCVLFSTTSKSFLSLRIVLTRLWSFPDINICYLAKVRIVTMFQSIQRNTWPMMIFFIALSHTSICKIPDQLLQAFHINLLLFALCWKRVVDLALQIPFAFLLNLTVKAHVFGVPLFGVFLAQLMDV